MISRYIAPSIQIQGFQPSLQNNIKKINIRNNVTDFNPPGAHCSQLFPINSNVIESESLDNQRSIYAQADSMLNIKSHNLDMGYEVQGLHL